MQCLQTSYTTLAIDCIAVEDEYGNTPAQRAELDWLLYNKPWSTLSLCWVEGRSIIFPLAVTTADRKIKLLIKNTMPTDLWFSP